MWQTIASGTLGLAFLGLCGAGCAPGPVLVGDRQVLREQHEFTGRPYALRQRDAHPQGAAGASTGLRGDGGSLTGRVCGVDVFYQVEHRGDTTQLTGTLDGDLPVLLQIYDRDGTVHMTGSLASRAVDLRLGRDGLVGFVGRLRYTLPREGDSLVHRVMLNNSAYVQRHEIQGVGELLRMTPAAQGALLPIFIDCLHDSVLAHDRQEASFRFGGPEGSLPATTLVYRMR